MGTVLLAGSKHEASAWQRRYPNRWTIVAEQTEWDT